MALDDDDDTDPLALEDLGQGSAPKWSPPQARPGLPSPPAARSPVRQPPAPFPPPPAQAPMFPEVDLSAELEVRSLRKQLLLMRIACVVLTAGLAVLGTMELVARWRRSGETKRMQIERAERERAQREDARRLADKETALATLGKRADSLQSAADALAATEAEKAAGLRSVSQANEGIAGALAAHVQGRDIRITHKEAELALSFGDRLLFATGKGALTVDGFRVLYQLAQALEPARGRRFLVVAQTSGVPAGAGRAAAASEAWDTAAARAAAVARFLVEDLRVAPAHVLTTVRALPEAAPKQKPRGGAAARPAGRTEVIITPAADETARK